MLFKPLRTVFMPDKRMERRFDGGDSIANGLTTVTLWPSAARLRISDAPAMNCALDACWNTPKMV